ncbi:unnamed protein product [Moneuplotes crassus]|uniref:Uncharacterized protein n=1 Tax=Euplotes crassus TaxID=5936 RepID=A0AAD1U6P3_EUPCR|nr:unnamed protein product [Moneuplotes crassus]
MESYQPQVNMTDSLKQKLQLFISCRKLRDLDYISKSDPFVEVYLKNDERSSWILVGKTETIQNNLNPDFSTPIIIDYFFEKTQDIRFEVWDQDPSRKEKQGSHTTKVAHLLGARDQTYFAALSKSEKSKKNCGSIFVTTDAVKDTNKSVIINLQCSGLKSKKEFFGLINTNHPFLEIKRCRTREPTMENAKNAIKVYTSKVLKPTLNPSFDLGEISLDKLCNSDIDLPLLFQVWSYQKSGKHRIYGTVQGSVREMIDQICENHQIIKRQGNPYGTMTFSRFDLIEKPTMVDYLRSGWKISLSVAIDFTASNGELSDPNSLHFIDPHNPSKMTQYEQAIYNIGNILEPYDSDKKFPIFGFGAKPRFCGIEQVSHCFHLNGQENPEVEGVQGILEAYRNAMYGGIGLYGPTNFTPCLQAMTNFIKDRVSLCEYNIMLYITDGAITDMDETIEEIVRASYLPMSIIIVGVGTANFSRMEALDSDGQLLRDKFGNYSVRDIVQFVEFNNYSNDISYLHEDVLREVPGQLVSYMANNNIAPNPISHVIPS